LANPVIETRAEQLKMKVFENRQEMGAFAAAEVAEEMKKVLAAKQHVRMVFAAAPSQNEFLAELCSQAGIDWSGVTAFHMDEYIGLPKHAPQKFGTFLKRKLFDIVKPGTVEFIECDNPVDAECERYGALIRQAPIDIVCLGIGENGHIAFNDPPVADFHDPEIVKCVELDSACRQQQVNDGCFESLEDVPTYALTLTVPALLSGAKLFCIVPGAAKHQAVQSTLNDPVSESCPSTILRRHPDCTLYLDIASYWN
jgi:glucosamine-6-phosphate deaminase